MINVNFEENAETPPDMYEEDVKYHIRRVVTVDHFNMKKGIDIFGNRSETEVMKELQKIHYINT